MRAVEPQLVEMLLAQPGRVERRQFLLMANQLIAGTALEQQVVEWKQHNCGFNPSL